MQKVILAYLASLMITNVMFAAGDTGDTQTSSAEEQLLRKMLKGYDDIRRMSRPVQDSSQPVNVSMGIVLTHILDLNEKESALTSHFWIYLTWRDDYLRWNASEYSALEYVAVSPASVWIPDIVLYNSVDQRSMRLPQDDKLLVYPSGQITWFPPVILKSSCDLKSDNFPFEENICSLQLGSWSYSQKQFDLFMADEQAIMTEYTENAEWELVGNHTQRNVVHNIYFAVKNAKRPKLYNFFLYYGS